MSVCSPTRACVAAAMMLSDNEVSKAILDLAHERGVGKTFCPSEVARGLSPEWRRLMPVVRGAAESLILQGIICATQKGHEVDAGTARGPIRYSLRR